MMDANDETKNVARSGSPLDVTIDAVPRSVRMFRLFENELDTISSSNGSIHWTFFGITAGAAITLGATLGTGSVPPTKLAVFTVTFWGSAVMGAYFLVMGVRDYLRAKGVLREIKKRPT